MNPLCCLSVYLPKVLFRDLDHNAIFLHPAALVVVCTLYFRPIIFVAASLCFVR
jgi:hypothetical protein